MKEQMQKEELKALNVPIENIRAEFNHSSEFFTLEQLEVEIEGLNLNIDTLDQEIKVLSKLNNSQRIALSKILNLAYLWDAHLFNCCKQVLKIEGVKLK